MRRNEAWNWFHLNIVWGKWQESKRVKESRWTRNHPSLAVHGTHALLHMPPFSECSGRHQGLHPCFDKLCTTKEEDVNVLSHLFFICFSSETSMPCIFQCSIMKSSCIFSVVILIHMPEAKIKYSLYLDNTE